jgi:hypothetical protein
MPKGLITSLLIKLTIDFWYLTLLALLIKLLLIRYTATNSVLKVTLMWFTGTITFYCVACISGIIFSSTGFYYTPFIMYMVATLAELGFSSVVFRINSRRLLPSVLIGNGLFFFLLFMQML